MTRHVLLFFFAITFSQILFADSKESETFRVRLNEDLGSLDWTYGEVNSQVIHQLMEGLTRTDQSARAVPGLASRWKTSGTKTEFFLRKNAAWSDGKRVCSDEFVLAWDSVKTGKVPSPFSHLFNEIAEVSAPECGRLVVKTTRPISYLPELVSHWVFFPVRKEKTKKIETTGPYRLKEWKRDIHYKLERNFHYYSQSIRGPKEIEFLVVPDDQTALRLFENKRIDWLKDPPVMEREKVMKSKAFRKFPTAVGYHLGFNFANSAYDTKSRCAISKALNKKLIPRFLQGTEIPAFGFLPREIGGSIRENGFSESDAKRLWKEGKHPEIIEISYYAKQIHENLMHWIQAELQRVLKTKVALRKIESKSYWSELASKPPALFLSGTTAYFGHPAAFLSEMVSQSPPNWGKYSNPTFDALVSDIAVRPRKDAIKAAENLIVNEDCAVVPLYFRPTVLLLSDKWLRFEMNPLAVVHLEQVVLRK